MADLASCYFCDAIDEPLDEHPLIPPELDPPTSRQRTVVVCPTCERKLDRAFDPLVSFLADQSSDREHGLPDGVDATGDATSMDSEPPVNSGSGGTDDDQGPDRSREDQSTSYGLTGGKRADEKDPDRVEADSIDRIDTGSSSTSSPPTADESDEGSDNTGGTDGSPSRRRDLPPESKQVLRLLRNREFPVDRGEIETVASSAYELGTQECRNAIDALIEAGMLIEEDGSLERP